MTTLARMLAALAVTWTAAVGPLDEARGDEEDLVGAVRAFKAEKLREIEGAAVELRELIDEKARTLSALEDELLQARKELGVLEAFRAVEVAAEAHGPAAESGMPGLIRCPGVLIPTPMPSDPNPEAIPGTLDAVIPASAAGSGWEGTIRISSSAGGRLDLLHESGDGSGGVQAGAARGELVEIRVSSAEDARVIARALRVDGKPVVSWPDLRILPGSSTQPDRIDALERTIERLAEAVDRIDRRTGPPASTRPSTFDEAPAEIPPAPTIPD